MSGAETTAQALARRRSGSCAHTVTWPTTTPVQDGNSPANREGRLRAGKNLPGLAFAVMVMHIGMHLRMHTGMSPSTFSDDLFTVDSPGGEVRDTQRRGMWIEK